MKSYVIDLECTYPGCDERYSVDEINKLCLKCGRVLYARYDIEEAKKNFTKEDYLLLTGDPAIIGVACSIVSDITNGKYNLLKWDRQERKYYPIAINLYEKGNIDE